MHDEMSLSFRLESYLMQLSDINQRWTLWLVDSELAAMGGNPTQLLALEPIAKSLFEELAQVVSAREEILVDARQSGLPHSDLTSLARHLPTWEKASLRNSLDIARKQLANLRRLHVATWVLISQAMRFYSESMQLLTVGSQPHVYTKSSETDTSGGRLLDASL